MLPLRSLFATIVVYLLEEKSFVICWGRSLWKGEYKHVHLRIASYRRWVSSWVSDLVCSCSSDACHRVTELVVYLFWASVFLCVENESISLKLLEWNNLISVKYLIHCLKSVLSKYLFLSFIFVRSAKI